MVGDERAGDVTTPSLPSSTTAVPLPPLPPMPSSPTPTAVPAPPLITETTRPNFSILSQGPPVGMLFPGAPEAGTSTVVDPGGDVCLAITQSALAGAALFGAQHDDASHRGATADFGRAIGYVLRLVKADPAVVEGFDGVVEGAESGAGQQQTWRALLVVYEAHGTQIDRLVDSQVPGCPGLGWFPANNSYGVISNLKSSLENPPL